MYVAMQKLAFNIKLTLRNMDFSILIYCWALAFGSFSAFVSESQSYQRHNKMGALKYITRFVG